MLNKWPLPLELSSFAAEPARRGDASLADVLSFAERVSCSLGHATAQLGFPGAKFLTPSLPTHTQNLKQIMRKTQNNLLNRYQGLLQGALTTLKYNKYQ